MGRLIFFSQSMLPFELFISFTCPYPWTIIIWLSKEVIPPRITSELSSPSIRKSILNLIFSVSKSIHLRTPSVLTLHKFPSK